jgi:hypothetical protein
MAFVNSDTHTRTYDPDRGLEVALERVPRESPHIFRLSSEAGGQLYFWASFQPEPATAVDDPRHIFWTVVWVGEVRGMFPQATSPTEIRALIVDAMTAYGYFHRCLPQYSVTVRFEEFEDIFRARRGLRAAWVAVVALGFSAAACLLLPISNELRLGAFIGAAVGLGAVARKLAPSLNTLRRR